MKYIQLYFLVCVLVFALAGNCLFAEEEIPFSWQGTINVTQKIIAAGGSTGEVTTNWILNINLKETQKNDIKDNRGRLVGQLVKLEDNGSTWEGTTTGKIVQSSQDVVYAGGGSGSGNAISYAWVYYSLSDNDPLKDILPNGSYCIGANSGLAGTFNQTITYIDRDRGSSYSAVWPVLLGYFIGGKNLCMPFGHIKGPECPGPSNADAMGECITKSAQIIPRIHPSWDSEARALIDEVMQGNCIDSSAGTLVNELSWNISKVMDVSCIIEKADKNWRPSVDDKANTVTIKARIKESKELKGKWIFTLFDVSKEKGIAMNKGKEDGYDLEFPKGQDGFDYTDKKNPLVIESTESANEVSVKIKSLDYGAWGKLKAKANIEGHWYTCKTEDGKDHITVPFDEDNDHIVDVWEEKYNVKNENAEADNDKKPESKQDGDGFTNYEEYRGFFVNGEWKDTDPGNKDIFIYDELGCGVSYFSKTNLKIHLIKQEEYNESRIVNFTRGYATLSSQSGQKGLYLHEGALVGLWGQTKPCVGTPNVVEEVIIDEISGAAKAAYEERGTEGGLLRNYASTIAHELGHAVNIMHHGDEAWEYAHDYKIARRGGLWSGDIICAIRYELPEEYKGSDGVMYPYPVTEEGTNSQTDFCTQKTGTEINAPGERKGTDGRPYPVSADAERGGCRNNITLKGYNKWGN